VVYGGGICSIPRYMRRNTAEYERGIRDIPRYMAGYRFGNTNIPQIYRKYTAVYQIYRAIRRPVKRDTRYTAVYQYTALIYRGISAVYLKTRLIYRGFLAVYRGILAVYRGILAVYLISRRYPVSPSVHIPSIYRHIPSYTVHIPSIYRRYTEPFRHRVQLDSLMRVDCVILL
jgi:hypothetical protein